MAAHPAPWRATCRMSLPQPARPRVFETPLLPFSRRCHAPATYVSYARHRRGREEAALRLSFDQQRILLCKGSCLGFAMRMGGDVQPIA
ncbi:hypothetical protein NOVOSPHI9U_10551 [Novosphingobium sp. 9U]|nr:hypothetical protein NOVOSPHI9U_10551 [Novosphingobium sp. 9U]